MAATTNRLGRSTTAKMVAGMLRDEIQDGVLEPGTRLRQNEVADRFGVSTTPVREAFAQLQVEGLVRIDPHRGAVVFRPTAEDLLEYYEIREVLETLAVTHAVEGFDDKVAAELTEYIDRMRETEDAKLWLQMNDEFHLKLYECARRPRLSALIETLREASNPYIYMFIANQRPTGDADDEHQMILEACMQRDADAARQALRDHLRHTSQELTRRLEERSSADEDGAPSGR